MSVERWMKRAWAVCVTFMLCFRYTLMVWTYEVAEFLSWAKSRLRPLVKYSSTGISPVQFSNSSASA